MKERLRVSEEERKGGAVAVEVATESPWPWRPFILDKRLLSKEGIVDDVRSIRQPNKVRARTRSTT